LRRTASPDVIAEAERRLGVTFPAQTSRFFASFDGLEVVDPPFVILPMAEMTRRGSLIDFCCCDGRNRLAFDVGTLNHTDQWSIVNAATDFVVTLSMASFWATRMFGWIGQRRPIWYDPFEHERR
jgi:hypothetical protein